MLSVSLFPLMLLVAALYAALFVVVSMWQWWFPPLARGETFQCPIPTDEAEKTTVWRALIEQGWTCVQSTVTLDRQFVWVFSRPGTVVRWGHVRSLIRRAGYMSVPSFIPRN